MGTPNKGLKKDSNLIAKALTKRIEKSLFPKQKPFKKPFKTALEIKDSP